MENNNKGWKYILIAMILLCVSYYFGYTKGAAYDQVNDYKDIIAMIPAIGAVILLIIKRG